jgi:hypothetical protein
MKKIKFHKKKPKTEGANTEEDEDADEEEDRHSVQSAPSSALHSKKMKKLFSFRKGKKKRKSDGDEPGQTLGDDDSDGDDETFQNSGAARWSVVDYGWQGTSDEFKLDGHKEDLKPAVVEEGDEEEQDSSDDEDVYSDNNFAVEAAGSKTDATECSKEGASKITQNEDPESTKEQAPLCPKPSKSKKKKKKKDADGSTTSEGTETVTSEAAPVLSPKPRKESLSPKLSKKGSVNQKGRMSHFQAV